MTRTLAPRRTAGSDLDAFDATSAMDVLEVVLCDRSHAADRAGDEMVQDPNVAQDCLVGMDVPLNVARRVGSRGVRALYLGRHPPVRLTLGAAVVLHVAQRWASIGTAPEQILAHAHDAADRVVDLTPDRTSRDVVRAAFKGSFRHTEPRLGVAIAGRPSSRVMHVDGDLTAKGAELLVALTDQFVREGSRSVRMDLADITTADHEGLRSVERLRTSLEKQGVTMLVSNRSQSLSLQGIDTSRTLNSSFSLRCRGG
jgi:anti-anti-sigma regulatory factor